MTRCCREMDSNPRSLASERPTLRKIMSRKSVPGSLLSFVRPMGTDGSNPSPSSGESAANSNLGRRQAQTWWTVLAGFILPEDEPLDSAVHRLTRGQGAQVVFDAVGGPLFEPALRSLAHRGRQLEITSSRGWHSRRRSARAGRGLRHEKPDDRTSDRAAADTSRARDRSALTTRCSYRARVVQVTGKR
jgi:hypothetical protein